MSEEYKPELSDFIEAYELLIDILETQKEVFADPKYGEIQADINARIDVYALVVEDLKNL